MDNEIDPSVGNWYQRLANGQIFQVVAVDDDEELVEFQYYDGDIAEVSLDEWQTWDLEVTAAPEDWRGPMDEIQRGDLGYSEVRSEGERRGLEQERRRQALQSTELPGSEGELDERPPGDEAAEAEDSAESGRTARTATNERADQLTRREVNAVKTRLTGRREELRLDILRELEKYEDESYTELAGRIADSGEQSWSDLVSDLNLAEISRDVGEARNIQLALERLAEGNYGICMSCDKPIDPERLEANPAAVRCLDCQEAYEQRDGQTRYPSL